MSLSDDLKLKLEQQTAARISKESPVKKLLHTIYLGDRTIQQLGQEPISNGIKLNNASVAIGDPMLPLAKGDVLRRVDSINRNGGKALGSAQRTALERDGFANNRTNGLGENGDIAPINNPNIGTPLSNNPPPKGFDPPFGCEPPVQNCVWLNTAIAPDGYGSHGSVVLNNDGLELFLYCTLGTTPPPDLGCDFNRITKYKCVNGVCVQYANGVYASLAACNAALIPRIRVTMSASFTSSVAATFNDVPLTSSVLAPIGAIAPFTATYAFQGTANNGQTLFWVTVTSSNGMQVNAGCFGTSACGKLGADGVSISISDELQCPP